MYCDIYWNSNSRDVVTSRRKNFITHVRPWLVNIIVTVFVRYFSNVIFNLIAIVKVKQIDKICACFDLGGEGDILVHF